MYQNKILFVFFLSCIGASANAFDFTQADQLFLKRENNLSNIAKARAIYRAGLENTEVEEMIYAVDHLGRLAYYEGELLTDESEHSRRRDIFNECQNDVEKIAQEKIGKESPTYYYWKAACLAMWAKSAKPWSVPGRVGDLEDAMNRGLALDGNYEGGGMHRVMGAVYLKSKMLSWVPGLGRFYNPEKALYHIEKAIAIGPEYYNVYIVKAEILKALDRSREGQQLLKEKAEELQMRVSRNALPIGLEPESKILLKHMRELLKNW